MEELRSVSICKSKRGKDIRANDASSLTDNKWKTLTNLVTTWSRVVLPINHQYYKYTQEQVGDRKKQPSVGNIAVGIVVRILGDTH